MMRRNHCKEGQEKEVRDFRMSYFISLLALIRAHVDFHFLSFFFSSHKVSFSLSKWKCPSIFLQINILTYSVSSALSFKLLFAVLSMLLAQKVFSTITLHTRLWYKIVDCCAFEIPQFKHFNPLTERFFFRIRYKYFGKFRGKWRYHRKESFIAEYHKYGGKNEEANHTWGKLFKIFSQNSVQNYKPHKK